nr:MAG TPA: TRANSDUCIN, PHOSDUCIN, GADOLINIUM ATOM, TRANSDUCIN, BETA-GAMMA, SIGNAL TRANSDUCTION.4A [Bacteriophage sp.]
MEANAPTTGAPKAIVFPYKLLRDSLVNIYLALSI